MITSPHNPKVKHAIKLRERRQRESDGLMLVEGHDELALAVESGLRPRSLFYCPELFATQQPALLLERLRRASVEFIEVDRRVFEKLAYRENPDGWLAVVPMVRHELADLAPGPAPFFIVAEALEKPGNLGAILRSADAAGVDGLILCDPIIDLGNPNVVRPSRGTLFSVPLARASSEEALLWLRQQHVAVVAASPDATLLYTEADLRGPVAITVGAESTGLSPLWRAGAHVCVRIPMMGRVNSLNVATSASLLLYEVVRQRATR